MLVVVAGLLAVVWLQAVRTLTASTPAQPPARSGFGVVWNGVVYTSPERLRTALRQRGISWTRWVKQHPAAFHPSSRPSPAPAPHEARLSQAATSPRHDLTIVFAALAAALALAGVAPRSLAMRISSDRLGFVDYRTPLLAAAASVAVGVAVASLV